jgi:serine/threonine-protein kinase
MKPDRWRALSPLLDRALDLEGEARDAWLGALRRDDPNAADEIASMLSDAKAVESDAYLEHGPEQDIAEVGTTAPTREFFGNPRLVAGKSFGPYRLERLLGHGGMGAVWLAHRSDGRYEGKVAVKLLNAALIGKAAERRFRREGDVLARLAHPHITRLLDAGVDSDGQPYLVLEIVEGDRIDAHCDASRLGIEARLQLFLDVLAAVEHAHAHLVVHRDIKPDNVLVTNDGVVKLLDFGIAKLLEDDGGPQVATQLTREGGRLLTPEYAAPEQLVGQPVTTATDVYALGVLLYALLAGRHPLGDLARPPAELIRDVVTSSPVRLSTAGYMQASADAAVAVRRALTPERLRQRLRGDLDSIVAKALEKDPKDRYASVTAFAEDIRRHLSDVPVTARPDSLPYRSLKFVRRNQVAVLLSSIAAVATLAGFAGTFMQAERATSERDFALRQLARAAALDDFNGFLLYGVAPAGKAFTSGELMARAERVVVRAVPDDIRNDMLVAMGGQYLAMDDDADARRLLLEAYGASRSAGDPVTHARAACNLSKALARQEGDRAESLRVFDEAMAALPDEPQYRLDRIGCLLTGSDAARAIGEARLGIERAIAAQRLIAKLPFPSKAIELRAAIEVAESYRIAGDFDKADIAFATVYEQMKALGRDDTQQAGSLLNNWGVTLDQMGQPVRAEALLHKAIDISRDDDKGAGVSPMLLTNYARVLTNLGRDHEALAYVDRAYADARREGNELVTNMALSVQAVIRRNLGDMDGAERALDEVTPRLARTLPPDHFFFALALSERALIAAARNDPSRAMDLVNQSVERLTSGTTGNPLAASVALVRRAKLELEMGRPVDSEADATRALTLEERSLTPGRRSVLLGRTYLALGQAEEANGKHDRAKRAFAEAAAQLRLALGPDHPDTRRAEALAGPGASPGN